MRSLSDRLDQALSEKIEEPVAINEANWLRKFLSVGKKPVKNMEPVQQTESKPDPEPDPEPDRADKIKASGAPTTHIASYAVARGKGFIRVGVEGDKSLTKARLHIFKKGNRYFGFLVIPGPGGKRVKTEEFRNQVMMILETDIYEVVSDVVLKYDSDDLGDLFDLSNYTSRSGLNPGKFSEYEKDIRLLDVDNAEKVDLGRLPWGKEQRQAMRQEDPVDVSINELRMLADKYEQLADQEEEPFAETVYRQMVHFATHAENRSHLENLINNIKKGIKKFNKIGDKKSIYRSEILQSALNDIEMVMELDL